MNRPASILVVAWIIIAVSIEGVVSIVGGLVTPLITTGVLHVSGPISVATSLGAGLLMVDIALGALMLYGFGWARVVYLTLLALELVSLLVEHQPPSLALSSGIQLIVFGYFLCRRESREFFSNSRSPKA